jgi:hypothetical protein
MTIENSHRHFSIGIEFYDWAAVPDPAARFENLVAVPGSSRCISSATEPAPALIKMKRALGIPAVQLVNTPGISRKATGKGEGILVASADRWLAGLP